MKNDIILPYCISDCSAVLSVSFSMKYTNII